MSHGPGDSGGASRFLYTAKASRAEREAGLQRSDGGRWPANVVLDEAAAEMLDEQSGELTSGSRAAGSYQSHGGAMGAVGLSRVGDMPALSGDSGGASRFLYTAKASRAEREAGLHDFTTTNVNDGRQTSIDNAYQRGDTMRRNTHPTLKPVDLTRWLATLLLPPKLDRPRRILVPFAGSGSEMIGCLLAGWDEVVGVELSEEYAEIARARLAHWQRYGKAQSDRAEKEANGQTDLLDMLAP